MEKQCLERAIGKLARMGVKAGLTIDQMIQLLNDRLQVEDLLDVIAWRLENQHRAHAVWTSSSGGLA
jgi:hypothetical protein